MRFFFFTTATAAALLLLSLAARGNAQFDCNTLTPAQLDSFNFFPPCINCSSPYFQFYPYCDDGILCTLDTCDSSLRRCLHTARPYCNFTRVNSINGTCVEYPPAVTPSGVCSATFNNNTNTYTYAPDCPNPFLIDRIVEPTCIDQCQSLTGSCKQCLAAPFKCRYCKTTGACFNESTSPGSCAALQTVTDIANCQCTLSSYNKSRQWVVLTRNVASPHSLQTLVRQSTLNASSAVMVRFFLGGTNTNFCQSLPPFIPCGIYQGTIRFYVQNTINGSFTQVQSFFQDTCSGLGAPFMFDFERDILITGNIGGITFTCGGSLNRRWEAYERNATTGLWFKTFTASANLVYNDVSLSSESAQTAAISDGNVYVFERNSTTRLWAQTHVISGIGSLRVEMVSDRKLIVLTAGGIRIYQRPGIGSNFTVASIVGIPASVVGSPVSLAASGNTFVMSSSSSVNSQPRHYIFRSPTDTGNYSLVQELTFSGTNAQYSLVPVFNFANMPIISPDQRYIALGYEGGPIVFPNTAQGGWLIYERIGGTGPYLQRGFTTQPVAPSFGYNTNYCNNGYSGGNVCPTAVYEGSFFRNRFYTAATTDVHEYIINGTNRIGCCSGASPCTVSSPSSCFQETCVNNTYCNVTVIPSICTIPSSSSCATFACNTSTGACYTVSLSNASCRPLIDSAAAPCVTGGTTCNASCNACPTNEDLTCAASQCSVFTGCHSCTLAINDRCGWCASTHTCIDRFAQTCSVGFPQTNCTLVQDPCGVANGYSGERFYQTVRTSNFPTLTQGRLIKAYENATLGARFIVASDALMTNGGCLGCRKGGFAVYRQNISSGAVTQILFQIGGFVCFYSGYQMDIQNMILAVADNPGTPASYTPNLVGRVNIYEYNVGTSNFVFKVAFTFCRDTLDTAPSAFPCDCISCDRSYLQRGFSLSEDGQRLYVRGQTSCGSTTADRNTVSVLVFQRNASAPTTPWALVASILHPDPVFAGPTPLNSQFGHEITVREPYVFISDPVPSAFTQTHRLGIVYVYLKSGLNYTLIQRVVPPGSLVCKPNFALNPFFKFGYKVDQRGLYLAISAPNAESEVANSDTGEVYIYRRSNVTDPTYRYLQKLRVYANNSRATPANALFGMYVALTETAPQRLVVGFDQTAVTLFRDQHWRGGYLVYQFNASRDAFQMHGALLDRLQSPIGPTTLHTQQISAFDIAFRDTYQHKGRFYVASTVSGTGSGNFIEAYTVDAGLAPFSCCDNDVNCADLFPCTTNEKCIPGFGCNKTLNNASCAVPIATCKIGMCTSASGCVNITKPDGAACGGGNICMNGACVLNASCLAQNSNCNNTANGLLPCVNQTCNFALGCQDVAMPLCDIKCENLIGCQQCLSALPSCGFCANTGKCIDTSLTPLCPVGATTPETTCAVVDPLCTPNGGVANSPLQNIDDFSLGVTGTRFRFRIVDAELDTQPTGGQSLLVAVSDYNIVGNATDFPFTKSGVRIYRRAGPPGTPFTLFRTIAHDSADVITAPGGVAASTGTADATCPNTPSSFTCGIGVKQNGYALELESNTLAFLRGGYNTGICGLQCILSSYYYGCIQFGGRCDFQYDSNTAMRAIVVLRKISTLDTFSRNCTSSFFRTHQFDDSNSLELTRDGALAIFPAQTSSLSCNASGTRIYIVNATTCGFVQRIVNPATVVCNAGFAANTQWGANVEAGSNCLLVVTDHRPASSTDPLRRGRVYVYSRCAPGPSYVLVQTINAPQSVPANGQFGFTIDAGSDNFFVACAVGNRRCYAFRNVSGSFALVQELYTTSWLANFGDDVAVAKDDSSIAVRTTSATANTIDPLQSGRIVVWIFNATLNRYVLRGSTVLFNHLPLSQVTSESSGLTGGFNIANNSIMLNSVRVAGNNHARFDQHSLGNAGTLMPCCNISQPACIPSSGIACQPTGLCTLTAGGTPFCDPIPNSSLCSDNIACTTDTCVKDVGCVFTPSNATCSAIVALETSGPCVTSAGCNVSTCSNGCLYSTNATCAPTCEALTGQGCWQCLGAPMKCKYCPTTKQCMSLASLSICNDSSIPINTTCANATDECGKKGGFARTAFPLVNRVATGDRFATDGYFVVTAGGIVLRRDSSQNDQYVVIQTIAGTIPNYGLIAANEWLIVRNRVLLRSIRLVDSGFFPFPPGFNGEVSLETYVDHNYPFLAPLAHTGTFLFNNSLLPHWNNGFRYGLGYEFTYDGELLYLAHMAKRSNLSTHGVYLYNRDPYNVLQRTGVLFSPDVRGAGAFGANIEADRNATHGRVAILDQWNGKVSPTCPFGNCPRLYIYRRVMPLNDGSHVALQIIEAPPEARCTTWGMQMALANRLMVVCAATNATEPSGLQNAGRCYVYRDAADNGNYLLIQVIRAVDIFSPSSTAAGAFFGSSVSLSEDNLDLGISSVAPKTYYGTVGVVHMFRWSTSALRFVYKGALIRDDSPSFASNNNVGDIIDFFDNITAAPQAAARHAFSIFNGELFEHCIGCARNCCVTNIRCDDSVGCTNDVCVLNSGCTHTPIDSRCNDFRTCTTEYCNATLGCVITENDAYCRQQNDQTPCRATYCSTSLSTVGSNGCVNVSISDGLRCNDRCNATLGDLCIDGFCIAHPALTPNCTIDAQCQATSPLSCAKSKCINNKCSCVLNGTRCNDNRFCTSNRCVPTAFAANTTTGCVFQPLDSLCANASLPGKTDCIQPVCNATTGACQLAPVTNVDGAQFLKTDFSLTPSCLTDSDGTTSWASLPWVGVGFGTSNVACGTEYWGGLTFAQYTGNVFTTKCTGAYRRALPLLPVTSQYQTLILTNVLVDINRGPSFAPCFTQYNLPLRPAIIIEISADGGTFQYLGCIGGEGGGACGLPPTANCLSGLPSYSFDISFINANATNPTIRIWNGQFAGRCAWSDESGVHQASDAIRIDTITVEIASGCRKNESCSQNLCVAGACTKVGDNDYTSYRDDVVTSSYSNTQGLRNWAMVGAWSENLENPSTPFNSPLLGNLRADLSRGLLLGRMGAPAFPNQNLVRSIAVPSIGFYGSVVLNIDIRPRVHATAFEVQYATAGPWAGVFCIEGSDPAALGTCFSPSMNVPVNGNQVLFSVPLNANLVGPTTSLRIRSVFLSAPTSLTNAAEVRRVEVEFRNHQCTGANKCYYNRCANGTCTPTNITVVCEDNRPCTNNTCNNATGCAFPLMPGFRCIAPGLNPMCVSNGTCNATGACVNFTINATRPCNQTNRCRVNTTCGAQGLCTVFQNRSCTDFNNCTIDQCTPEFGCIRSPIAVADSFLCTVDGCTAPSGTITHVPNNTLCPLAQYRCVRAICNTSAPGRDSDGCVYSFNTSFCRASRPTCNLAVCNPLDFNADANGCVDVLTDSVCDRGIPCQTDTCMPGEIGANATTGCLSTLNNAICNDNIACTNDVCVLNAGCTNTPQNSSCPASAPCGVVSCVAGVGCVVTTTNAGLCDTNVTCDQSVCNPGAPFSDANGCVINHNDTFCSLQPRPSCSIGLCEPTSMSANATTGCTVTFATQGTSCDDGLRCTLNDLCINGTCVGTPLNCSAALFCTLNNTCNPSTGQCVAGPALRCNDSITCTVDRCNETANTCSFTPNNTYCSVLLNPDPQCQLALCNVTSTTGCALYNRPNGITCNDTNPSTSLDACFNGACVGVPNNCVVDANCSDMRDCTADFCNVTTSTCYFVPNNTVCTLLIPPLQRQCRVAACNSTPTTGCAFFNLPNGMACNDTNSSTVFDACLNGFCVGVPRICATDANCSDNKTCTQDICNTTSNTCLHIQNNTYCQVTQIVDAQCQNAFCNGTSPTGCAVINKPDNTSCNDGNATTFGDRCIGGRCKGFVQCVPNCTVQLFCTLNNTCANGTCVAGARPRCNDSKTCTVDTCNATSKTCTFTPNNTKCTLLIPVLQRQCRVAFCNGTGPTGCNFFNRPNGLLCNDTNSSTVFDACVNGTCRGVPRNCTTNASCDDNKACTRNICNLTANRCVFIPNNTVCQVLLNPDAQCQIAVCNGSAPSGCALLNKTDGTSCNDGNATTNMDQCIRGRCKGTVVPPCLGKLVGELCPGGFCYLNTCIPCPLNNSCHSMQLNASCWLISSLVCNRLARDLLSVSMCLNGAFAPNGSFVGPTMTLATAMTSPFFSGSTVGQALTTAQRLVSTNALTVVNAQNCTQLIRFLTDMANVTGIYRAFQASTCPNSLFAITQAATWPGRGGGPGCGAGCGCGFGTWANEDLSSASDRDYNDNNYRVRIITGQDSLGRYAGTLIEKIPATLGTFYAHRVQFHPSGSPAAPTRLVSPSAPYLSGVGRVISRRFNTATYALAPTTLSTTHAQVHTLYTDTRAEQALQTGAITLSQRIINTCAARTQLLQAGSLITISAASRASNPTPKPPNPYDTPLLLVLKVTTVASAEVTPPRFNATGHATTKLDCLPGTGEFNSLWIDRANWRWPREGVKLATMCPQFAQCVQCVCGSAPSATCRSVCENFAFNCTQNAPLAC